MHRVPVLVGSTRVRMEGRRTYVGLQEMDRCAPVEKEDKKSFEGKNFTEAEKTTQFGLTRVTFSWKETAALLT